MPTKKRKAPQVRRKPPRQRATVAKSAEEAMAEPEKCEEHVYFSRFAGYLVTVRVARSYFQPVESGEVVKATIPALNPQFGHDGFLRTDDAELVHCMNKCLAERTYGSSFSLVSIGGVPVDGQPTPEALEPTKYTSGGTLSTADAAAALQPTTGG